MINIKDYSHLFPNYAQQGAQLGQITANNQLQQGQIWSDLLKTLASIGTQGVQQYNENKLNSQAQQQVNDALYENITTPQQYVRYGAEPSLPANPIQPQGNLTGFAQGNGISIPIKNSNGLFADNGSNVGLNNQYLSAPATATFNSGATPPPFARSGNIQPMQPAPMASGLDTSVIPATTQRVFNPTMEKILPLLTNPRTAPMINNILAGAKAMEGKVTSGKPDENLYQTDAFGKTKVISYATPDENKNATWQMEKNPDGSVKQYNFGNSIQSRSIKTVNGKIVDEKYDSLGTKPSPNQMQESINEFNQWRGSSDYNEVMKAIATGAVSLNSTIAGRYSSPKIRQQVLADVLKVNPDYKEYTFSNDKSYKAQYLPSGKIGQKFANLNTAIEHTGELFSQIENLGNDNAQFVNKAKNWFANTFGTSRAEPLNSFEAVKSALAGELGALFKGGNAAATDPEIDNISKVISSAQNPEALKGALKSYLKVGKARIDQWAEPYNTRFGENNDFLNENPRKILKSMGIIGGSSNELKSKYGLE